MRVGITYEQVAAVAESMQGDGKTPGIRAIREVIGGSPNTIHRFLIDWRASQPITTVAARVVPEDISASLLQWIDRAASQSRAEVSAKLVYTQSQMAELSDNYGVLEIERDSLTDQRDALAVDFKTLGKVAEQQSAQLADLNARIDREVKTAEAARVALARAQLSIDAHAAEIAALRSANAAESARLDAQTAARISAEKSAVIAEKSSAVLAAQLDAMTQRANKAEAEAEKIEVKFAALEQDLNSMRVHVQVQQNQLNAIAARESESKKSKPVPVAVEAKPAKVAKAAKVAKV